MGCKTHSFELLDLVGIQGTHQEPFNLEMVLVHSCHKAWSSKGMIFQTRGNKPREVSNPHRLKTLILKRTFPSRSI